MSHTMQVPDEIWSWAEESCEDDGPASFLRNILIKDMRQKLTRSSPIPTREGSNNSSRGKTVHPACYEQMIEEFAGEEAELPNATLFEARFDSLCPRCKKFIHSGDQAVKTNL